MSQEEGEKRVFSPEFAGTLSRLGLDVHIEEGYGARSGLTPDAYRTTCRTVRFCDRDEAFRQDLVFLLRSPREEEFGLLHPGTCLISMLHFPTRPLRIEVLRKAGAGAISLDSIANDANVRLVENMRAVAWNGLEAAFDVLEKESSWRFDPAREPLRVVILGTGMVGRHAADAASKTGNIERNKRQMQAGAPGIMAINIGRNITANARTVEPIFRQADIMVDATQRRDTSRPVVPNDWIAWLPPHAVITDLAVDPYTLNATPAVVRGVEGIPQGSLDKYVFHPKDPEWDRDVPSSIPSRHRRWVVSCYSWPGIHPGPCMQHYARQLEPMMEPLVRKGYEGLSPQGKFFERALFRATLRCWLESGEVEIGGRKADDSPAPAPRRR